MVSDHLNVTLEGANEDAVRKSVIYESSFGCDFLLSPKLPNATDVIPIDRFDEIFTVLRRMYDVIVNNRCVIVRFRGDVGKTGVDQLDIITNLVRIETGLPTYSCQCR